MTIAAGTQLGPYEILSLLGAGGMGEVYCARDARLNREVAIKVLPASLADDADRLSRFAQEAQAASALNHPNIITIHEVGEIEGLHFIVTEFIDGHTLRQHVTSGKLTLQAALEIAAQTASALVAAHEAGIVHRDIKPENIMLRRDSIIKVLDFGLAKLTEMRNAECGTRTEDAETRAPTPPDNPQSAIRNPHSTDPGTVMGTASYMSPEQARGQKVDARTDLFSLGVVLYEMIAGRPPFDGVNALDVISAILQKEPQPLATQATDVPAELQRIVSKALRKNRDERYQTARDLLNDLKDLKEELSFAAKQARSGQTARQPAVTASADAVPTTAGATAPTASSAKIILGEIQRHKLGVALVLALLLAAVAALSSWAFFASRTSEPIESIAVMPFVNASGNAEVEYLSDGMTETLISSLSQLPNLNVKARSSVFRYKGKEFDVQKIAQELKVQAILTGRVVQRGEQLTLSLELVDARTENAIWSEQYNRKQTDLVTLQSEIARDVSTKLKSKLSGTDEAKVTKSSTDDPEAYQLYLKGRFYWNKRTPEGMKIAIEQFKAASEKDPSFALAYVGLADSYSVGLYSTRGKEKEAISMAKGYATRALEIDPSLAEAHASLGLVNKYLWKWDESEGNFKRAIELNPNYPSSRHWYSRLLRSRGRFDEAFEQITQAQKADDLSLSISNNLAENLFEKGDIQGAIAESRRGIEIAPVWFQYRMLAHCYLRLGQKEEALANARKAAEFLNGSPITLKVLGYVQAAVGNRNEALTIVRDIEDKFAKGEADGRDVAVVYAGLGENDKVFEWLEKDFQTRNSSSDELRLEAPFMSLRNDPRFKDLLKRMGLPE